jgi:L-threonylcarbamoyladenylate synthase
MRISAYKLCQDLCSEFGGALVSTSANRHGQESLLTAESVLSEFANDIDYLLDAPTQKKPTADVKASAIRDALTGMQLR